ncbi:hypothetical protein V8E54_006208 [Elaphomyces granulatus]
MAGSYATIPDYFSSTSLPSSQKRKLDDRERIASPDDWQPRQKYDQVLIGELSAGPRRVTFTVRVVNIYDRPTASKSPRAAKGCLRILAKDHSGCILVSLWYADVDYPIELDSLISVWSPHLSAVKPDGVHRSPTALMTSIFPERDGGCQVVVHDAAVSARICKIPLEYTDGEAYPGLSVLAESRALGSQGVESKMLVYVKGVGTLSSAPSEKGQQVEKVDIGVADQSGEAILTMFGRMAHSAQRWTPFSTVLLISRANWTLNSRLSINSRTTIAVDPDIAELEQLRKSAISANSHVNQPYPENVFDVEALGLAPVKLKFTLADIDEFVRSQPNEVYLGYMSVLITEVNIVTLYRRRRLFSMECCNMPLFANALAVDCGQCGKQVELRLNPNIIGALTDETGTISCSPPFHADCKARQDAIRLRESKPRPSTPLIWSPEAWCQLLGRGPEELLGMVNSNSSFLMQLQSSLQFMRITVIFGWSASYRKLAICRVLV